LHHVDLSLLLASGGCGARAARVEDGRYCLPTVEPDAGGESLVKPVRAHRLPDSGHHLGLSLTLQRPRPQADTLAEALGRPRQQRGPFPVACTNASWANAVRHRVMLRVLWVAKLSSSPSSSSAAIIRELGTPDGEAQVLNHLGDLDLRCARVQDSIAHHRQALAIHRHIGNQVGEVTGLNGLGVGPSWPPATPRRRAPSTNPHSNSRPPSAIATNRPERTQRWLRCPKHRDRPMRPGRSGATRSGCTTPWRSQKPTSCASGWPPPPPPSRLDQQFVVRFVGRTAADQGGLERLERLGV
jgi:hypothetical protein